MAKRSIVYLQWLDSASVDTWSKVNTVGLSEIVSVGFLIYEDDTHIQIANSMDENDNYCGIMAIPKAVITNRLTIPSPEE